MATVRPQREPLSMHRISLSRARRLYASDVEIGCWLVFERNHGGAPISPVGYGATEEEARKNARRYDGEACLIVPDEK